MKISNSKKELAKIICENGGWRKGSYAAQDYVIRFFTGDKPKYNKATKLWDADNSGLRIMAIGGVKLLQNRQRTILSRAEYFHLYPAPDADGWIEWNGGECPVLRRAIVDIRDDDGHEWIGVKALDCIECDHDFWAHTSANSENNIIAYRPHKPEKAKSAAVGDDETNLAAKEEMESMQFCESVTRSIPVPEVKPTIEQLAADYRNKLEYADRKRDEADKANMESDAALSELEKAIAAIGFAITPIGAAVQGPELATPNWRNWVGGDEIKCKKTPPGAVKSIGLTGFVSKVYGDWVEIAFEHHVVVAYGRLIDECFEFVSRPAK